MVDEYGVTIRMERLKWHGFGGDACVSGQLFLFIEGTIIAFVHRTVVVSDGGGMVILIAATVPVRSVITEGD
jgi:hypothetical protein